MTADPAEWQRMANEAVAQAKAEAAEKPVVNMLCIRDPDYSNDYTFDAEVNEITIDVGGSWSDYRDFASCLRSGDGDALEYEQGIMQEVIHLPADNVVRRAVESFFAEARQR